MEDVQIIELYWQRREEAIACTQEQYGGRLQRLACGFLEEEDARETVNDTYLAAWNSIPPQRPQHLFAYLAKICRNLCLNVLEKANAAKRKAQVVTLTQEMALCIPDARTLPDTDPKELGRLITHFLQMQSRKNRVIFMRRYFFGDSVQQIAAHCGVSQGSVKTSLHRTREKLREYLEGKGVDL